MLALFKFMGYFHIKLPENEQEYQRAVRDLTIYFSRYQDLEVLPGLNELWFNHPEEDDLDNVVAIMHGINPRIECYNTNSRWLKRSFPDIFRTDGLRRNTTFPR